MSTNNLIFLYIGRGRRNWKCQDSRRKSRACAAWRVWRAGLVRFSGNNSPPGEKVVVKPFVRIVCK